MFCVYGYEKKQHFFHIKALASSKAEIYFLLRYAESLNVIREWSTA